MKLPKVRSAPEWRSANAGRATGGCGSNPKEPKYIGAVIDEIGELSFASGVDGVGELLFAGEVDEVGELPVDDGAADTADPTLVFPTDGAN